MESIIARALEYTLKYWLKSFSRDQFKLQGRTAQLSNLDINGDALHASLGLPPALTVDTARVGKLQITLPSVSNVQVEPIVVNIDKLDLVLVEKDDSENLSSPSSASSPSATKSSGYGYADKIADGMTVQVGIVNLLLETHGGARREGGATWSPPLAAITFRDLVLYTTNEKWQVVNLKEARDFSNNKGFIYVFKKLEWQSLSVDLLPHPDMFTDARFNSSSSQDNKRDNDGAKRMFFGGERFLEGISGEANITVQRTELNNPLGLEVQLHITEAVCPALSEPGLRAFLRFMTGVSVCLNRGDVDPKAQQLSEAAGSSLVSIIVDHIFLCIKDTEFQLELLMQSLFFSRASISDGGRSKNLSCIKVGGLFLRDTFSRPPCTLMQPSMQAVSQEPPTVPDFGQNFCPPIYPFGNQLLEFAAGVPLFSLYCLQITPPPSPPKFASKTVITCQPFTVTLQEQSCLRIASFLADGVVPNRSAILPDSSINSLSFSLKEFVLSVPLDAEEITRCSGTKNACPQPSFSGARLHVEDLYFCQSPSAKCPLLNLERDPASFLLWEYQPVDASQMKWATRASHISLSLETSSTSNGQRAVRDCSANLWKCIELDDIRFEAAMVTADGSPLLDVPPPEGVVRIGVAFQQFTSNTSVEQLFFVLGFYTYFGQVAERISKVSKGNRSEASKSSADKFENKLPSDTAVSLTMNNLQLNFLESLSASDLHMPLVQFGGEDLFLKVSHRTLGGAFAVTTNLMWRTVSVNCLEGESAMVCENGTAVTGEHNIAVHENGHPKMRAVFWVDHRSKHQAKEAQFIDISITHVMPSDMRDMECHSLNVSAKVSGVRLGGGMTYTESLLHRFGILGPDGGPGEGLLRGLKDLSSGPLAKLFKSSHLTEKEDERSKVDDHNSKFDLGVPDDLDVSIELRNWLFALEGTEEVGNCFSPRGGDHISREEKCWHSTFRNLHVSGKSSDRLNLEGAEKVLPKKAFPVERFTAGIEGLQAIKPCLRDQLTGKGTSNNHQMGNKFNNASSVGDQGVDIEATMVIGEDEIEGAKWTMDNVKFSVKEPIEAVATKEELEHLAMLCRSEADAMGRITAAILRLLKLDKSLGQGTIEQLRNLGSGGMDNIFSPRRLSRQNSIGSIGTPRTPTLHAIADVVGSKNTLEATISALQAEISESKAKFAVLISKASSAGDQNRAEVVRQLNEKLESMQSLVARLRTLIN
ncbi:uncharacterized protein LOC133925045 isoform X2 [Phragmites australis]|uniref:uncharacterized protein LOC133925045 isoform X2 n=1 Tax=Phragmites australis TaxID=29695 RepID=UPI002D77CD73|nr:uncharacterized protein LOC133925045 isoform X2 [Phragmites australis]